MGSLADHCGELEKLAAARGKANQLLDAECVESRKRIAELESAIRQKDDRIKFLEIELHCRESFIAELEQKIVRLEAER